MSTITMEQYTYRPGLIFLSKHAGLLVALWPERYHVYPDGQREMVAPPGFADFELGVETSSEFIPVDDDGNPVTTSPVFGMESYSMMSNERAQIRGGAFDLDLAVRYYGWSDEQREMAAQKLLMWANDKTKPYISLYEPKPPQPPWPTYDTMKNYLEIAKLADDLGLLNEALGYERLTKNRPGIMEAMETRRRDREAEETLTAE